MSYIVVNRMSQNGLGGAKWDKISGDFKNHLCFAIEEASDWAGLAPWLIQNLANSQAELIIAGGDGTVHSVIQILMAHALSARVGLIGLGSSNDYHKPHATPGHAQKKHLPLRLDFKNAKRFDLLKFSLQFQGETKIYYSALNGSIGITALANSIFNDPSSFASHLKKWSASLAINEVALQAYLQMKPLPLKITFDGQNETDMNFVKLGFFKRAYFAGSFHYDQAPDECDGRFGFARTRACSKLHQLRILLGLARGRYSQYDDCKIDFCQTVRIQSQQNFILEIDGETQSVDTVQVEVLNGGIVMCP